MCSRPESVNHSYIVLKWGIVALALGLAWGAGSMKERVKWEATAGQRCVDHAQAQGWIK